MAEWNIVRPDGRCAASDRTLEPGEEIYCVLFETPEGWVRRDFAADQWTGAPPDAFCHWKSRVPEREQKKRTFVDDEILTSFFTRLADQTDPQKLSFRFVLGLILMRKRLLKYDRTERDDRGEVWVMRMGKDPTEHRVLNPQLDDARIHEVSAQLGQILHSDMGQFDDEADEFGQDAAAFGEEGESTGDAEPESNASGEGGPTDERFERADA